ncbi:hypothetical protein [Oceanobacillus profundus]|nr:hypothetical protein [Oceanobacillus profundus]MDO6449439.1 hypothetical protein [Oceanobacillus profundus]
MKGTKVVFIIIITTIISLILTWLWLQDIIVDYDLDRAMMNSVNALI